MAWGEGDPPPAGLRDVVAITAGIQSLALKRDGTVVAWNGGTPPPAGLSRVVAISAGGASAAIVASP